MRELKAVAWVVFFLLFIGVLSWMFIAGENASDLRKQETGYCVAIGGERITDGKCQVGDKIVVITGLDK